MAGVAIPMDSGAAPGGIPGVGAGDGDLNSFLAGAFDSAVAEQPETPESSTPEPSASPVIGEPGIGETEVPAQPTQQEPTAGGAADSPYTLTADGKFYQVPKGELPQFQTARTFYDQVSQHFATPQEAQQAAFQAADLRIMSNDFTSGNPDSIAKVLNHFAGADHFDNPAMQQRYQQSFAKMAELMPATLKQVNPQAYQRMVGGPARFDAQGNQIEAASGLLLSAVESAYERAAQSGNPADLKYAQETDYAITGTYKPDTSHLKVANPQQSAQEREMQQFRQQQDVALNRDIQNFNSNAVEGAKFKMFDAALDKTLAKVKDRYPADAYKDLKDGIHRELIDTMKNAPDSWWTEHSQEFSQIMDAFRHVWRTGGDQKTLQARVQSYNQSFTARAQRLLPAIAQKRIGAATNVERARNGQFAAPAEPQTRQPATATPVNGKPPRLSADDWQRQLNDAMRVL